MTIDNNSIQRALRAQVRSSVLYRIFNIAFALLFGTIVLLTVFNNPHAGFINNWLWPFVSVALGTLTAFTVSRLFNLLPDFSLAGERITVILMLVLLLVLQSVVGVGLITIPPTDTDFGMVYHRASSMVLGGALPDKYFLYYPSHTGLYLLFCGYFSILKLFGVSNFMPALMVLNILAIAGGIALCYFCVRRLFGTKKAVFSLLASFFVLPYIIGGPVVYTYTLLLPLSSGMVLLWLKARTGWRAGDTKGFLLRWFLICILAGLGAFLKLTILIVWIAIALDLLLLLKGRCRARLLLAGTALLALILLVIYLVFSFCPLLPAYNESEGIPSSFWVMMGLGGNGGYNQSDLETVLALPNKQARSLYIGDEIGNRWDRLLPAGIFSHLAGKLAYIYGDAAFGLTNQLTGSPANWQQNLFMASGSSNWLVAGIAFGGWSAMLVWMTVAAAKTLYRKNDSLTFIRLSLFGITLFLLVWKAAPGELITFLPLFMLAALEAAPVPLVSLQKQRAKEAVDAILGPLDPPDDDDYLNDLESPAFTTAAQNLAKPALDAADAEALVLPPEEALHYEYEKDTIISVDEGDSSPLETASPEALTEEVQQWQEADELPAGHQRPLEGALTDELSYGNAVEIDYSYMAEETPALGPFIEAEIDGPIADITEGFNCETELMSDEADTELTEVEALGESSPVASELSAPLQEPCLEPEETPEAEADAEPLPDTPPEDTAPAETDPVDELDALQSSLQNTVEISLSSLMDKIHSIESEVNTLLYTIDSDDFGVDEAAADENAPISLRELMERDEMVQPAATNNSEATTKQAIPEIFEQLQTEKPKEKWQGLDIRYYTGQWPVPPKGDQGY